MLDKLSNLTKSVLRDKKKRLIVGLGGLGVITFLTLVIAIPIAVSNSKKSPTTTQNFVRTTPVLVNENSINIEIEDLKDYNGQELTVEYKPTQKPNAEPTKKTFVVKSEKETVVLSGLLPWTKYSYKITTKNGSVISSDDVFTPYLASQVVATSTESSVNVEFTIANTSYTKDQFVIKYAKAVSGENVGYTLATEVTPVIEDTSAGGKTTFVVKASIPNLNEGTPYQLFLGIKGQNESLITPFVEWTNGSNMSLYLEGRTNVSAKFQIFGLQTYIITPSADTTFALKYWKRSADESTAKTETITLPTDAKQKIVIQYLQGLEPNTAYKVKLVKTPFLNNGTPLASDEFTTLSTDTASKPSTPVNLPPSNGGNNGGGGGNVTNPPVNTPPSQTKSETVLPGQVEGAAFTENVTFNVSQMNSGFPVGEVVSLQWRSKPSNTSEAWAALSSGNSKGFTVSATPSSGDYKFVVPKSGMTPAPVVGTEYQWRLVKKSAPNTNLLKGGVASFNLTDGVKKTFNAKIKTIDAAFIKWRNPLYENIVGSALGEDSDTTMWRPFAGLKTKKDWRDFLEWLAYQNDTVQNTVVANITQAFKTYTAQQSSVVGLTSKFTALPFLPSDKSGDSSNGNITSFKAAIVGLEPKFGGYNNNQFGSDAPIKPSDFMGTNNRFKDWSSFPKAIKYLLNGIKNGWNRTDGGGISRDNIYIDNWTPSQSGTYASYFVDKKAKILANFTLEAVESGWTLELTDNVNPAIPTTIWSNDQKGELYFTVKATKGSKTVNFDVTIGGFKINPKIQDQGQASELTFELAKDHSTSIYTIDREIINASTVEAKKAVIEKYYNIKYPSIYSGWDFVSAALSTDKTQLVLKARIGNKKVTTGSTTPNNDAKVLSNTVITNAEFTYNLKGFDFANLPELKVISTKVSAANPTNQNMKTIFLNVSWTYEQMVGKMKDLNAKLLASVTSAESEMNAFRDKLLALIPTSGDAAWTDVNSQVHFRPLGKEFVGAWGDQTYNQASEDTTSAGQKGFSTGKLTENSDTKKKTLLTVAITTYGSVSPKISS